MKSEDLKELKEFGFELCSLKRSFYSSDIKKAKLLIKQFLKKEKIRFVEEKFTVSKYVPSEGDVYVEDKRIEAITYGGSPISEEEGTAVLWDPEIDGEVDIKGKIVISREGGIPTRQKAEMAEQGGAKALITYIEEIDTLFVGNVGKSPVPVVNVRRSDVQQLIGNKIKVRSKVLKKKAECSNIYFDVGKGPLIYVTAHIDTKPFVYGAIDNGISVVLLLFIARELHRKEEDLFCRYRFLITDCEEFGLEGASFHVQNKPEHAYYAVNLDSVGWHNPAIIYKDAYGYNDEELMDKFLKHIKDFSIDIPFRESRTGVSDHVVFKRKGIKSMFLSSNPFTLRHTDFDTYELVAWNKVEMWHDLLLTFFRRFDRL